MFVVFETEAVKLAAEGMPINVFGETIKLHARGKGRFTKAIQLVGIPLAVPMEAVGAFLKLKRA